MLTLHSKVYEAVTLFHSTLVDCQQGNARNGDIFPLPLLHRSFSTQITIRASLVELEGLPRKVLRSFYE